MTTTRTNTNTSRLLGLALTMTFTMSVQGQQATDQGGSPSGSLMANAVHSIDPTQSDRTPHALQQMSLFAVVTPEPRSYQRHDLVQIIVRETSRAESSHELETEKKYNMDGGIDAFPSLDLADLLDLQVKAGDSANFPINVGVDFSKEFEGEGDYKREDDLTARLTAEVIEILPNGNLVLEARTYIKNDQEEMTIKVTGICRPDDVTSANTVLSNQIHDLRVEKTHAGELKKANEKGIIARVLDAIFAF